MKKIKLNQVPAVPSKMSVWKVTDAGHHQCGDVQIRLMREWWSNGPGTYLFKQYGLWVKHKGKWRRCWAKGRMHDYGGLGSAKIGASRTKTFVLQTGEEVTK